MLLLLIALVLVLTVPDGVGTQVNVPLTCGNAYQDQSVFWKKDGNGAVLTNKGIPAAMPSHYLTSSLHFSQVWSLAQLFRGTRSRSW